MPEPSEGAGRLAGPHGEGKDEEDGPASLLEATAGGDVDDPASVSRRIAGGSGAVAPSGTRLTSAQSISQTTNVGSISRKRQESPQRSAQSGGSRGRPQGPLAATPMVAEHADLMDKAGTRAEAATVAKRLDVSPAEEPV